jgi:hypothetical protein
MAGLGIVVQTMQRFDFRNQKFLFALLGLSMERRFVGQDGGVKKPVRTCGRRTMEWIEATVARLRKKTRKREILRLDLTSRSETDAKAVRKPRPRPPGWGAQVELPERGRGGGYGLGGSTTQRV